MIAEPKLGSSQSLVKTAQTYPAGGEPVACGGNEGSVRPSILPKHVKDRANIFSSLEPFSAWRILF